MNPKLGPNQHLLAALAIATTALAAVHMSTFVWLTAFVYRDNIRGYVPAGMTGLSIIIPASFLMLIYLGIVRRRYDRKAGGYFLAGCLSVPLAILLSSIYTSVLLALLGRSWKTDVAINTVGVVIFLAIAIVLHRGYMRSKTADNQAMEAIGDPGSPQPHG